MTVDIEYCEKCQECLNEYSFNCCLICEERCNFCDDCDEEYLITLNKLPRLFVIIVVYVLTNLIHT